MITNKKGCAGHVACMGGEDRCIKGLVRKPGGKRPLERPRHITEDNIEMYFQEVGWWGMGLD
jgi:hypothetical protein